MLLVKHPQDYDLKDVPKPLFAAMGQFVTEQVQKGVMVDGAGLKPLRKSTRVHYTGNRITTTDGPFAEAKEVVGGYMLIETGTHEEAVALARRMMELHETHWPDFRGEIEVRPFQ